MQSLRNTSRDLKGSRRGYGRGGSHARRRGGSVLELALTLSILFSVTFGMVEFGQYFFVKNSMEGAAREGCRAGIVSGATNTTINTAIEQQLQAAGLVPNGTAVSAAMPCTIGSYSVSISDTPSGGSVASSVSNITSVSTGDTLTVTITATWGTVGAAFRPMALISSSKTITTIAAMRKEG